MNIEMCINFLMVFTLLMFSMVFDWIYQTNWESKNKFTMPQARAAHSLEYSVLASALVYIFGILGFIPVSFSTFLLIWLALFVTHYYIDDRKAVLWWMVHIKRIPKEEVLPGPNGEWPITWWLQIGIDQCFHFVVNFTIAVVYALLI